MSSRPVNFTHLDAEPMVIKALRPEDATPQRQTRKLKKGFWFRDLWGQVHVYGLKRIR
jgi:hypothetical protein